MIFDLKATESSSMRQSVVISDKKWNSFGVILNSICLAAAGLSGVACAGRGHHPPPPAEPSGRATRWWAKHSGFLSTLQRRTVPGGLGFPFRDMEGEEPSGRNVFLKVFHSHRLSCDKVRCSGYPRG